MKGGVNLGYQSEAELAERLMTKLESQGYERIKIEDYEALVENFRKQLNIFNAETLEDWVQLKKLFYSKCSYSVKITYQHKDL